ncbi:MAG TPA: DUF1549 and DUF1553 domain-containing protein [Bryobacteraceae bacterium]|jgi:hypothetical protein
MFLTSPRFLGLGLVVLAGLYAAAPPTPTHKPFTDSQKHWWAFQPVVKPPVPTVTQAGEQRNPIDAFILAKLQDKGLTPSPPADKITLLRRASLDLIGLPPTAAEVQDFLADNSPDAFAKVVDRLLASPHYGERWGRHWLDLARYADSEGFKSDETRPNIWRYRDYVIDSLNADKPYDRFVKEQIAGDEIYPGNADALVATGFNRHFPDESNARNLMQRRQELLNDITDTVSATFIGMTFGCARCHDHKFDPILQRDYYRLQAFFANTRIEDHAELIFGQKKKDYDAKHAIWEEKTKDVRAQVAALTAPMLKSMYKENFDKFPPEIQDAITTAGDRRTPVQWQMYQKARPQIEYTVDEAGKKLKGDAKKAYADLADQLAALSKQYPVPPEPIAQVMIDNDAHAPATHVLNVGVYDAYKEEVQPGFLTILDPVDPKITPALDGKSTGRRTVLANWLADPKNPLSTRVIVNRVWHYHFGRGISGTPSDFGLMGERPANKELLDYLTATFIENGWSLKKLHRMIMLSNAYQQASGYNEANAKIDPEDKFVWRYNPHRLEGEVIRDSMLQVSGLLNDKMHGPGVFPPLPPGIQPSRGGWKENESTEEADRRSVYIFVRRNMRYPMIEVFDMPDTHESCARRDVTTTAPQALELLNNELVLSWSRALSKKVANDAGLTPDETVSRAFRLTFSREPSERERKIAADFLARQEKITGAKDAAVTDLCHMLLNSNEFVYIN